MKVIHVSAVKGIAGSEGHLLKLLPGLKSAGVDVEMVVLGSADKTAGFIDRMRLQDIPVVRLGFNGDFAPGLVLALQKIFRAARPDIVHTHLIHADIHGTVAAKLAGVRHVVTSRHNIDAFRKWIHFRAVNWMLWRMIDRGITISNAVREFTYHVEPPSHGKLQTIHYGLEARTDNRIPGQQRKVLRRQWHVGAGGKVIGSVGRLIDQKGIRYGLEAFGRVCKQIPDVHYVIAGDGMLRQALTDQATALGLQETVHFLGWQDRPDDLYETFDIFLFPSLWEGFGLVLLEAMSHRLPVVTTNASAMSEIVIEEETGFLVPPADPDALAERLIQLLTNSALSHQMGEAGRNRVETVFTIEKMVQETLAIYHNVIGN